MTCRWISIAGVIILSISGCQCCPLFDSYANCVDDASDRHIYFDRFYNPKCDISRIGRPDWNSPFKTWWCPRCNNGTYDRYDDCTVYPPLHPFQFPSNVMPLPTVRRSRLPKPIDPDEESSVVPAAPSPKPALESQ